MSDGPPAAAPQASSAGVAGGDGSERPARRRLRGLRVAALAVAGVLGLVAVLSVVAFAADRSSHAGRVARNVTLAERDVSSLSPAELGRVLDEVARGYARTEVLVADDVGDGFTTSAGAIGLRVDPAATAERVLAVGRQGSLPSRWWSWLASFRSARRAEVALIVDPTAVERLVREKGRKGAALPTEPTIKLDDQGRLVGVAGQDGRGILPTALADDLPAAAGTGGPVRVKARWGPLPPRFTKADADALAAEAERLVAQPLALQAEATTGSLPTAALRKLISSAPGPSRLELRVDEAAAAAAAEAALSGAGTPPVEPTFKVGDGDVVTLVPGAPGRACCGPEAGRLVAAAVLTRPNGPVALSLVERRPKLSDEQAATLGVKEQVSSFATRHACCQPRVRNIQRISDIVRGQVIPPGGEFSVNGFVGKRTTEKGFVVDKVIEEGRYTEDVGGGVSQFATTLFNAAWFAGMEFGEYQSHSLYISRYPRGREATLGFPHPDLVIKNPSPYGVMIWPTYSGTEIRITLYSTKWVEVKEVGQDTRPNGSCTVFTTRRQRTFLDGRVVTDSTRAQYRAGEGQNCR